MDHKTHPTRSLRTRISLAFGALAAVLSALLSWGYAELLQVRIQREAGNALYSIAGNAATLLAQGLLDRSTEVQVLANSEELWTQGLDHPDVQRLLGRSQAMQPNSLWIGVADLQGVVKNATGSMLVGQSVRERPWFRDGLQGTIVGDVHPAKLLANLLPPTPSGEPPRFVDFAAPVRVQGQTVGVLGIHGSWEWARQVIEALKPPYAFERQLALFIFDRDGTPIYAPGGKTDAFRATGQLLPLAPLSREPSARARTPLAQPVQWKDGVTYLTASVRMQPRNAASDLGWQVVAREPAELAFAERREAMRLALAIGVCAALLAAVLGWLLATRLSRDLYTVAKAARSVEQHVEGAQIPLLASSREVHALSSSLISMTQRLLHANQAMEAQVLERTRELQAANQELDRQVRSDPLTGVLNRRGFDARLQLALAQARRSRRPFCVVMVDADHFKRVNDSYGHDVGDQVLKRIAGMLAQRLRVTDVVARLGGEEFVALLPDTSLEAATGVAEELVAHAAALEHPAAGKVTISAGLAIWKQDEDSADPLLRRADEALYDAKHQGRNRVVARTGEDAHGGRPGG